MKSVMNIEISPNFQAFLRKFTSGSVLAYICTKGVEVLEKLKRYEEAVEMLQFLVGQNLYLPDYHGHWYER